MKPSPGQVAGAFALVLAAAFAVATHQTTADPTSTPTHFVLMPNADAGLVAGGTCILSTATTTLAAAAAFPPLGQGLDAGGQVYALVRTCPQEVDGGSGPALPPGMFPLSVADETTPYDGGSILEVWLQGEPSAPWRCACSTGSDCTMPSEDGGTVDAPLGMTLQPGWSGAGCRKKPCVEWSGISSWPTECPLTADGGGQ